MNVEFIRHSERQRRILNRKEQKVKNNYPEGIKQ